MMTMMMGMVMTMVAGPCWIKQLDELWSKQFEFWSKQLDDTGMATVTIH